MESAAEAEVGGLFQNGQIFVPLRITIHELSFLQPPIPIKIDNSAAKGIVTATFIQKSSKAMAMQYYWMKDRVKQKNLFFYWKPRIQNMEDYFTKHHPPHHRREICATYLYMEISLLKIYHKGVTEWANSVLTPNHTISLTPNHTDMQGCDNVVRTDGHSKPTTVT